MTDGLGRRFDVVTNIRRADVSEDKGWVVLELEGEEEDIEQGIAWVGSKGVRVDPVIGDALEG
ncbi:FeS-binding protein [Dehalococcoidia bacterium]|nr:FeS-binding protein [Dehalococcoidia bacterium]